jgi:hypothetical protein
MIRAVGPVAEWNLQKWLQNNALRARLRSPLCRIPSKNAKTAPLATVGLRPKHRRQTAVA